MSNNPPIYPAGAFDGNDDEAATREVDGDEVLDTDANDDLIDSADADRLATVDPDDDVEGAGA